MDHAVDGTWYEWPYHFNQWKCSWPNWAFTETFIHLFSSSKVNLIAWGSKVCQVLWFQMRHGVLLCRDQWDSEDGMWDSQLKKNVAFLLKKCRKQCPILGVPPKNWDSPGVTPMKWASRECPWKTSQLVLRFPEVSYGNWTVCTFDLPSMCCAEPDPVDEQMKQLMLEEIFSSVAIKAPCYPWSWHLSLLSF
jgi:hypothetical protein